jgi:hypothetical protein
MLPAERPNDIHQVRADQRFAAGKPEFPDGQFFDADTNNPHDLVC